MSAMADDWATMEPDGLQIQGQWLRHVQSRPDDHAKGMATIGCESNVKFCAIGDALDVWECDPRPP